MRGVTAIRIIAGMTLQNLAVYLGVSKSLLSMVENGQRYLPQAALYKLTQLQMAFNTMPAGYRKATEASSTPKYDGVRIGRATKSGHSLHLSQLKYELVRMESKHAAIQEAICLLSWALENMSLPAGSAERTALEFQLFQLKRKVPACSGQKHSVLRAKIALLEELVEKVEVPEETILPARILQLPMLNRSNLPRLSSFMGTG